MKYSPSDSVYVIRAQAHTSVLRTVHNKRVITYGRKATDTLALAAVMPVLLAAFYLLYLQNPISQTEEKLHMAAPIVQRESVESEEDPSIEEQKAVIDQVCNAMCWDERIASSNDKLVLINFCTDVCGIPYVEPVVSPESLIDVQQEELSDTEQVEEVAPKIEVLEEPELEPEPHVIEEPPLQLPELTVDEMQQGADLIESSLDAVEQKLVTHPHNHIGMYLTPTSTKNSTKYHSTLDKTKNAGGNAIIIDVKGSFVYFQADSPMAEELGLVRPMYDLPEIVKQAHEKDMYVMARFIAVKDPSLASRKPETQIQNIYTGRGIGNVWVSPNHPDVISYNKEILREVLKSGIDEVNFDYIRYPTEYNQAAINLTGEEKADKIFEFLTMARELVNEMGVDTKLGVSTFAILGWNFPINFEPLGQDIARFAELVDVISPMAYPSTFSSSAYYNPQKHPGPRNFYLVYRTLMGYKELLGEESWKIRPWIQGYYMTSYGMQNQIRAVYEAGLCGYTVWNAHNEYNNTYQAMTSYDRPEHCL